MKSWRALRALLRVEWRELVRQRGRSALVVLLVAVPVAALVGGSALYLMTQPTLAERRAAAMGRAALKVSAEAGLLARLGQGLPGSALLERVTLGRSELHTPGRRFQARTLALDPGGLAEGMLRLRSGRAPGAEQVALSPVLLAGLGCGLGDVVTLDAREVEVVGEVVDPEHVDRAIALLAPATLPEVTAASGAAFLLVQLPPEHVDAVAERFTAAGAEVLRRSEIVGGDGFESAALFVIGGLGFFEAALVVAAAFAVGFRRRQRELGLLAASGAPLGVLRASLLLSALLLALIGGALGVTVGAAATALLHPFLDAWTHRVNGPLELSVQHVLGALALGALTALGAAALPTWSATRLPIRVALSGRRPIRGGSTVWFGAGAAMVLAGVLAVLAGGRDSGPAGALLVFAGSALGVLGFGAASPWILAVLARGAAPLPLAWRLAVRDAGRFRARNGPVVTAVLAGTSICILLTSFVGSIDRLLDVAAVLRDDQLLIEGPGAESVARELRATHPCVAAAPLAAVHLRGEPVRARFAGTERPGLRETWIACGDADLLACAGVTLGAEATAAGHLVVALADDRARDPAGLELLAPDGRPLFRARASGAPEFSMFTPDQDVRAPVLFLAPAALAAHRLQSGPPPGRDLLPWLVRLDRPVSRELLRAAQTCAARFPATSVDAQIVHESPTASFLRVVVLLTFATGLLVIFIATSLSSVESAADARTLFTLGTSPGVLRRHQAARAGYLAFLGCALAVPAGLIPAAGLLPMASVPLTFVMPWPQVLLTLFGLPAIAYGGTWLHAFMRKTPIEWRRAS